MPFDVQGALNAGYSPAQIADEVGRAAGFDTAAARKSGYSDDQIIKELAAPTHGGPADSSYLADLKAGTNSVMDTTGTALQGVGGILSRNGLPGGETLSGAGDFLKRNAPEVPQNYHNRGSDIVSDLGQGNFSRAAGDVLHGVVSAAPAAGAAIGAGALGSMAGAPAALGAGLVGGVMDLGAGAGERAAAAGRAVPNTEDTVRTLPRAGAAAFLSAIGPGKLAARSGTALTRAATMGAASGGQSAVDQLDTTGTVDPAQVGNAAITGAATAGATELPSVGRATLGRATDAVMSRAAVDAPTSAEQAAAQSAAGQLYSDHAAANPNLNPRQVVNGAKTGLETTLARQIREAKDAGALSAEEARTAITMVSRVAKPQNNSLESGGGQMLVEYLRATDAPKEILEPIIGGAHVLDALSDGSFVKNQTGPFRAIGQGIGNVADTAALLGMGGRFHPIGALASRAGGLIDSATGLATPRIVLQKMAADRYLRDNGLAQPQNPMQALAGSQQAIADFTPPQAPPSAAQQAAAMGALRSAKADAAAAAAPPPAAPAPNPMAALARAKAAAELLRKSPAGLDEVGNPVSPVPVNTPLPAFRPNTASDVAVARAQDDAGLPPSQSALQAAQQAQATQGAPVAPTPPTGPQAPGRGHAYVAAGNPGVSAQAIHDAAVHLESTGQLPAGTAAGLANGIMPAQAKLIQGHLGITPNLGPNASAPGDVPTINSPIRYNAAVKGYQSAVAAKAADLRAAGQTQAADALVDIAVNHHTKAGKQAARAALPPHIRMQIPDFVVNQGG